MMRATFNNDAILLLVLIYCASSAAVLSVMAFVAVSGFLSVKW